MITHVDNPEEWFVRPSDAKRQVGALIDLAVSIAFLGLAFSSLFLVDRYHQGLFALGIPVAWALDVLVYALPLSRWGWSIGNVLTRRRVVRRIDGSHLSFGAAVMRYFSRRAGGLFLNRRLRQEALGKFTPDSQLSRADVACGSVVIGAGRSISWDPLPAPATPPAVIP